MQKTQNSNRSASVNRVQISWLQGLLVYVPFLLVLSIAGLQNQVLVSDLTRDVFVTANIPSYLGLISNLGVFVWCATATVCGLGWLILRESQDTLSGKFLLYSGGFSLLFMLDDFFLFHERLYPLYFHVSEKVPYLIYSVLFLAYLVRFRKLIWRSQLSFLIAALCFFAVSVIVDLCEPLWQEIRTQAFLEFLGLIEDGSKLLGIVSWCAYWVVVCLDQIRHAFALKQSC